MRTCRNVQAENMAGMPITWKKMKARRSARACRVVQHPPVLLDTKVAKPAPPEGARSRCR